MVFPDFYAETVDAPWFEPGENGSFRLWPHKLVGEGHFAAVLRRRGEELAERMPGKARELPGEWKDFAKALGITLPAGSPVQFGDTLYWAPEGMPDIRGVKVLRPGLELGQVRKGRFEQSNALALWMKTAETMQDFSAAVKEIAAYMHGDVISSNIRGWCLIKVDGISLGWSKGDGNYLKNHYPKGLRR